MKKWLSYIGFWVSYVFTIVVFSKVLGIFMDFLDTLVPHLGAIFSILLLIVILFFVFTNTEISFKRKNR